MDKNTVVKRIEEAIQASEDNTVELRVDTKLYRVRYDDWREAYYFEEKSNKNYEAWETYAEADNVGDYDIISWLRACIGQFKEPIWDTLLPDPKKAGVK
ncbi:MAG: hypothetical protein KJ043_23405 [Anaerolineae bacterium]|nr:hypothetical protein [Anaerolineae bacterium]